MSVLSPPWPSHPSRWNGHSAASFSALATPVILTTPVIPPLDPLDSPFPSSFNTLGTSPPRRSSHPQTSRQHSSTPGPSTFGGVPPRNNRSLDRDALLHILDYFSSLIPARFGSVAQIRLVVHGGAVMLLNAELARLAAATAATDGRAKQRTTTRDIDYIARSFSSEWAQRYGVLDANDRLKQCIFETALQFGLGADWMNSDADVALPMATDPATGAAYDPIHAASIEAGDSLTVYTSPNGFLKLVSVTPFWTVALKMVRYNPADREDICILLRSGTLARQMHWTPTRLEIWLLGTCWAMGYAGYDHERIKQMRRRMIEVVAEANRWDPHAVADDGRGGVVPLRPATTVYPGVAYGYGYGHISPIYNYNGAIDGDPRIGTPFRSPGHSPRSHTFPPSGSPSPFAFGPSSPPPPAPPKNKKNKKKSQTTAVTTWPNQWMSEAPQQQQQWDWDPESADRWDQDVRQTAAKEKKYGRMTSWIPFLRKSKSRAALKASRRQQYSDSEDDDSSNDDDSDSDDEDWRYREQLKWSTTGTLGSHGAGQGVVVGTQHSVADFMSGMTPSAASTALASGSGNGNGLPGWNFPGAQVQSPPPWAHPVQSQSPPPWTHPAQSRSPQPWTHPAQSQSPHPWKHPRAQPQSQSPPPWPYPYHPQERQLSPQGPGIDAVAANMNALGLYGI